MTDPDKMLVEILRRAVGDWAKQHGIIRGEHELPDWDVYTTGEGWSIGVKPEGYFPYVHYKIENCTGCKVGNEKVTGNLTDPDTVFADLDLALVAFSSD